MGKSKPNDELTTITELIVSTLATSAALAKLLIAKGLTSKYSP